MSRICSDSRLDQIIDMKHALVKLARDEALCDRWVENPCFQYFCGEEFFQHALVFDRSSLTRWRQRMGQEKLKALLQESLAVATRTDAMRPSDLARVVIDTTVQPKAVMFPTDAKLLNRGARAAGATDEEARSEPAPILCAGRKAGSDQASALRPCSSIQARQPELTQAQDLSRPCHPRHRTAHRRE